MHKCSYPCSCVRAQVSMCVYGIQRSASDLFQKMSFSVDSPPCIWKQSLSLNPELNRPVRNPAGPLISLPSAGIIHSCLPGFLCGCWGSDLGPPCLWSMDDIFSAHVRAFCDCSPGESHTHLLSRVSNFRKHPQKEGDSI